ncbi:MAG: hypothetical protein Q8O00_08910 [Holophaga sp.]|nr:hypothetical protein [Holophaga sp.]
MECLHSEGIPATSVVVLFQADKSDVYLDGGMVHEVSTPAGFVPRSAEYEPRPTAFTQGGMEMGKPQRKKIDFEDLKAKLALALETHGALSSFEAQVNLGLRDVDGAPAALRRVFAELDADGLISKQGQKRGTRYVWIGQTARFATDGLPKLVKRTSAEGGSPASENRDSE